MHVIGQKKKPVFSARESRLSGELVLKIFESFVGNLGQASVISFFYAKI
jgi:hypothetical protein